MRAFRFLVILAFAATLTACSGIKVYNRPSQEDVCPPHFVAIAASSDLFEIQSSQLALSRSRNPAIQQIAHRLIADHSQSSHRMKEILQADGIPAPAPMLMPMQQRAMEELNDSSDFDRTYLHVQARAHREAIGLYQNYAANGENADLRNFAAQTLPTLHEHLQMVEQAKGGNRHNMREREDNR